MKLALGLLLMALPVMAQLSLAPTFSDGMVIQRDQPIHVWGTFASGGTVTVALDGEDAETKVATDGRWQVTLRAKPASNESVELRVSSEGRAIVLKDVLIGDVWFCAGQSNMAMAAGRSQDAVLVGKGPGDGMVRFLNMSRGPFTKPIVGKAAEALKPTAENKAKYYKIRTWEACSPGKAGGLSAVAYWFARNLQPEIGVPVGLIVPPVGGSATQAWVSRKAIEADPNFRPILDRWIQDEPERLQKQLMPWLKANPGATFDDTPLHRHRPTTLFETAVEPVKRHGIKGVIWYQGEQNAQNEVQRAWFKLAYPALIKGFRDNWSQPDLPVYSVQLPGYGSAEWPVFREDQRQFAKIPNTGMVVTIDLGLEKNIHPKDKRPIGERLALLALSQTYGKEILGRSPEVLNLVRVGGNVTVSFSHVGDGLKVNKDGTIPGFELAGPDGIFVAATGRLVASDTVVVMAAGIEKASQIRYAWAPFPRPLSFANSAGLPVGPFLETLK